MTQKTNIEADMSDEDFDSPITDRDLAQILTARAEALGEGEITREDLLADVLQLVARETPNVDRKTGERIGSRGRVSFGRDRAGEYGTALFVPEYVVDESELDEPEQGEA